MIGVIVLPWPSHGMHGLDVHQSAALLPLGDRPLLQHIVEHLANQGVTSIEFLLGHSPEQVEGVMGNGDRWGCKFRYHLVSQPERPYRHLKIISETKSQPWILVHAEHFPCVEFPADSFDRPILYCAESAQAGNSISESLTQSDSDGEVGWKGTAVFPAGQISEELANQSPEGLGAFLKGLVATSNATVVRTDAWLDMSSPQRLLETQSKLLDKKLNRLMMGGRERDPGIWVSRNVVIHPSVELIPPLYIGPNSRINRGAKIGPHAVVCGECIIDANTTIEHSLVISGSYVGESLELNQVIVDRNLLVNTRLGTSVNVLEGFLLGGLRQPKRRTLYGVVTRSIFAMILIALLWPILVLALAYYKVRRGPSLTSVSIAPLPAARGDLESASHSLPCIGSDAWSMYRPAGWTSFLRQFLPGLFAVLMGRLYFVGLRPRPASELGALSPDWQALYQHGRVGLITEASTTLIDRDDEIQQYVTDAYYMAKRDFAYDLSLACRYFFRLLVPAPKFDE